MSTEQQYRVIGKSGPGVEPRAGMVIAFIRRDGTRDDAYTLDAKIAEWCKRDDISGPDWNAGEYEILEAISPPQAEVAACESWCGLPLLDMRVPPGQQNWFRFDACAHPRGCSHHGQCPCYCTQACLDRAKAAPLARCAVHGDGNCSPACDGRKKAPECIRSECKAPPVAGGELCAAHAGQVEAAKTAAPPAAPAPAEARLERWRREHKGYSHGTADPRIHDANVAAMMMGIDGPREPYVPPQKPDPWTPREVDGDIPDAWEPGGARLGRR